MSAHQNKTLISEIVDYWSSRIDECDLSVDWSEAEEFCWNCGSPKDLTRCHIIPHALNGKDEPANFVVLCRRCHEEAPNVEDPRIMWDWLIAHKSTFYNTYWIDEGIREYEFIYKMSIDETIRFIYENTINEVDYKNLLEMITKEATYKSTRHFEQSTPNKATVAGVMRMVLIRYAEACDVVIPDQRRPTLTPREYLT